MIVGRVFSLFIIILLFREDFKEICKKNPGISTNGGNDTFCAEVSNKKKTEKPLRFLGFCSSIGETDYLLDNFD